MEPVDVVKRFFECMAAKNVEGLDEVVGDDIRNFSSRGTLEGKESPRLSGLAQILRRVGWQVRAGADWLSVDAAPVRQPEGGGPVTLDSMGDHRMAFAGALLGLGYTGMRITGHECVGKSYPNFWTDLAQAGVKIGA